MQVKIVVNAPDASELARWLRECADTIEVRPFLDRTPVVLTSNAHGAKVPPQGRVTVIEP